MSIYLFIFCLICNFIFWFASGGSWAHRFRVKFRKVQNDSNNKLRNSKNKKQKTKKLKLNRRFIWSDQREIELSKKKVSCCTTERCDLLYKYTHTRKKGKFQIDYLIQYYITYRNHIFLCWLDKKSKTKCIDEREKYQPTFLFSIILMEERRRRGRCCVCLYHKIVSKIVLVKCI